MNYDLVSLGEVMLRLAPPKYERLRHTSRLDVQVAGSQLNVAANLARLDKKTAFVSKLPANELGLLARDACRGYGVDVTHIKPVKGARMGVNYLDFGATPRVSVAVYDRQGSAASTLEVSDFDWDAILADVRFAYTDGIFPGLSKNCAEATLAFLKTAKTQNCTTAFDVNYREHLWTPQKAREVWQELLCYVDVLATNRSVSEIVFGYKGSDMEIMEQYQRDFNCEVVCLTSREIVGVLKGAWSSQALCSRKVYQGRRFEFDVIDRFGTGDAWFSGFLYGYQEKDVQFGLNFGNALCALAHTVEGDIAHVGVNEVLALLEDDYQLQVKR